MRKFIGVFLLLFISGCAPAMLTTKGSQTAAMRADTAQTLPGHPLDNCKTISHLSTEYSYACRSVEDLSVDLRNKAGASEGNLVVITNLVDPGHACYHQAVGIAIFCNQETLRAAGITSGNMTPGITAIGPIQGLFGH